MGVPALEVGYTSATTGRGDHEVRKGHVVALEQEEEKRKEKKTLACVNWNYINPKQSTV
jgi:hypothetical protein